MTARFIRSVTAFLLLLAMPAMAQTSPATAQVSYVRAGKLTDVLAGEVRTNQLITIRDERIVAVGSWTDMPTDGSKPTVLPGLIDMPA